MNGSRPTSSTDGNTRVVDATQGIERALSVLSLQSPEEGRRAATDVQGRPVVPHEAEPELPRRPPGRQPKSVNVPALALNDYIHVRVAH
jgi:hypothetical protein